MTKPREAALPRPDHREVQADAAGAGADVKDRPADIAGQRAPESVETHRNAYTDTLTGCLHGVQRTLLIIVPAVTEAAILEPGSTSSSLCEASCEADRTVDSPSPLLLSYELLRADRRDGGAVVATPS